jgi:hypothetical protein
MKKWALALGIALAVAAVVTVVALRMIGGAERSSAHAHLPAGCDAVARIDLAGLREVGPVAEHVMPALDEAAKKSEDAGKMARFFLSAGLDPRKDLEEAALCATDLGGLPKMVLIIGGRMRPGRIVEALRTHADDLDGFEVERVIEAEGREILLTKDGLFITQADDGAVLIGTSQKLVEAALPTSDHHEGYAVPLDRQIGALITAEAVKKAGERAVTIPFARKLGDAGRAMLTVDLDQRKAVVELDMGSPAAAKDLAAALGDFLKLARLVPRADPITGLLTKTSFVADGTRTVGTLDIPKEAVEDGAKRVAERIRSLND